MPCRIETIVIDLSLNLTEQLSALRACGCSHVSSSLPIIGQCAFRHVLKENSDGAFRKPATGCYCQKLFRCEYCATDFRMHLIITISFNKSSVRVDT